MLADWLRDELLEEITNSQLQPGTKLPTEVNSPSATYLAPRARPVRALIEVGYITRRRGSQLCHERRRMPHSRPTLSYLAMIESAGARAGMRILDAAFEQCCPDDSPLQLGPVDTVGRAGTADDRPVIYSLDRIPARLLRIDLDLQNWTRHCSRC